MKFVYSDGGRAEAGFRGKANDCVTRAIALATRKPYQEVYDALYKIAQGERIGKRKGRISHPSTGIFNYTQDRYLEGLGWTWVPTMKIGQGCKVHLRDGELPMGRLIVSVSRHMVAVIDGVIHDTFDCSRDGNRCVYGYWKKD